MAIYYFGQGGASGNTGLSFAQRKATHTQLISALSSGGPHTVYMCAAASGAANKWTNTEQLLPVSNVTYHVFTDHYILMNPTSPVTDDAAMQAVSKSNITIEPADGFLEFGNPAAWQPNHTLGFNIYSGGGYQCDRQFYFAGCTNIKLIGRWSGTWPDDTATSNFKVFGARRYLFAQFDQNCDLYMVDGLDIQKHGTNNDGGLNEYATAMDWGNGPVFAGTRGYVRRCRMKLLGHAGYSTCRSFVFDDCVIDGDWSAYTVNEHVSRPSPIKRSGNRCFSMTGGNIDNDDFGGGLSPFGPSLMQNCIQKNSGSAGDDPDNANTEIYANHVICRFNYFWDGVNDAFRAGTYGEGGYPFPPSSVNYLKCYNNLTYANGGMFQFRNAASPYTVSSFKQIDVFNCIFDELRGTYWGSYDRDYGGGVFGQFAPVRWNVDPDDLEGFSNNWKGGIFAGNLIKNMAGSLDGPTIYINERTSGTVLTLAQIQSTAPHSSHWYNNVNNSPTYAGNPAAGARTKATFAPNGGLAVGTAEPHAIANGPSVGTDTTLVVDSGQARRFFDGWDLESFGLQADWIKIGASAPVQIALNGINYGTDTITLSSARVWADNDEVYLCLTPDGVNFTIVQDIGAGQTPGATIPATGVAGYIVLMGLGDGSGQVVPNTFTETDVGLVLTKTFTGLTPGQQYYFRVRAYDGAGNLGNYSSPRLFVSTNP